jgi:hypothetical protein
MRSKRVVRNRTRIRKSLRGGWPFKSKGKKTKADAKAEAEAAEAAKQAAKVAAKTACDNFCEKVKYGMLDDCTSYRQAKDLLRNKGITCDKCKNVTEPQCGGRFTRRRLRRNKRSRSRSSRRTKRNTRR